MCFIEAHVHPMFHVSPLKRALEPPTDTPRIPAELCAKAPPMPVSIFAKEDGASRSKSFDSITHTMV